MRYFYRYRIFIFQIIKMKIPFAFLIPLLPFYCFSQVVLKSDGPGNTYELINSVLAPGNEAVENPECIHPDFGRHIVEVFDTDLKEIGERFEVVIECSDENDQTALLLRLSQEGLRVRAIVI